MQTVFKHYCHGSKQSLKRKFINIVVTILKRTSLCVPSWLKICYAAQASSEFSCLSYMGIGIQPSRCYTEQLERILNWLEKKKPTAHHSVRTPLKHQHLLLRWKKKLKELTLKQKKKRELNRSEQEKVLGLRDLGQYRSCLASRLCLLEDEDYEKRQCFPNVLFVHKNHGRNRLARFTSKLPSRSRNPNSWMGQEDLCI